MHRDHHSFVLAIREKRKVKLTFRRKSRGVRTETICGPIVYSPSVASEDAACYYFWDTRSCSDDSLLVLPPVQIVSMELVDEPFDPVAFFTSGKLPVEQKSGGEETNSGAKTGSGPEAPQELPESCQE